MKAVFVIALIAAANAAHFNTQVVAVSDDVFRSGPYDKCLPILEKIAIEAGEIALLIVEKQYARIPGVAMKLGIHIREAVICFTKKDTDITALLSRVAEPDECVMTHLKNAIAAIRTAVQDLTLKLYKEALEQVKIALIELGEAQICPK